MRKLWRLGVLIALVAVSCRAEANVLLEILEDGSGTYTVELGLDEELQGLLESFTGGKGGGGILPGFDLDIPGLSGNPLESLESRVAGDMTFYADTESFATPDELEQLIESAGGENNFETFDLSVEGDTVSLIAQAGPPEALIPNAGNLPITPAIIEQAFSAHLIVDMPGSIKERNADEVLPDGRLKWEISLTEGVDVRAVSDLSESSFPWWLAAVVLIAALILAIGIAISRKNARRPATALAGTARSQDTAGFGPPGDDARRPGS